MSLTRERRHDRPSTTFKLQLSSSPPCASVGLQPLARRRAPTASDETDGAVNRFGQSPAERQPVLERQSQRRSERAPCSAANACPSYGQAFCCNGLCASDRLLPATVTATARINSARLMLVTCCATTRRSRPAPRCRAPQWPGVQERLLAATPPPPTQRTRGSPVGDGCEPNAGVLPGTGGQGRSCYTFRRTARRTTPARPAPRARCATIGLA